ncbi:MAG: hypothetical protein C5B51_22010 [Terriglobia bacterium]|nr:MAG: hypothetical protein C5B51_22010 [Terriglobia bacterium]
MKTLRCFAIILAAAPLWAGVRMKIDVTDLKTNKTMQQEILLDAARLRVNIGGEGQQTSVFFLTDGGRNRLVMLDRASNEYREMDEQTLNQVSQQVSGAMAQLQAQLQNMPPEQRARIEQMMKGRGMPGLGAPQPAARTTYTVKGSGSVNGFSCTKYEGARNGEKVADLCAAKPEDLHFTAADFQVFEQMRKFASSLTSSLGNLPGASASLTSLTDPGFEGFPIQQTAYSSGQPTHKTEVKSIDRASFFDADFSLGTAKKVDLMPGRGR